MRLPGSQKVKIILLVILLIIALCILIKTAVDNTTIAANNCFINIIVK